MKMLNYLLMLVILSFSVNALLTDAISYYSFDEDISSIMISENKYNATHTTPLNVSGKLGSARFYDNTSDRSFGVTSTDFLYDNDWCINFWFNTTTNQYGGLISSVTTGNSYGARIYTGTGTDDLNYWYRTTAGHCSITYDSSNTWYNGSYHMITMCYNVTGTTGRLTAFYNNNLVGNFTCTDGSQTVDNFSIGARGGENPLLDVTVDELGIWDRELLRSEITELYNNSYGMNPYSTGTPFIPSYNVTIMSTPDINLTTFIVFVNTTINDSKNNSWVELSFMPNTTLTTGNNYCAIYEDRKCSVKNNFTVVNMTRISNIYFNYTLYDTDIFPGYYPFYREVIDNKPLYAYHNVYTNNNIKFEILNFTDYTGDVYIFAEFDAKNKTDSSSALGIFYCNSSYTTGNPLSNSNCELIDSYLPNTILFHKHNLSEHITIPVKPTINKTFNSSILFVGAGNSANGWNFRYIENESTYTNHSFKTGNYNSWATSNKIFDIHIHQLLASDYLVLKSKYFDGSGYTSNSNIIIDFFNITQFPPNNNLFIYPNNSLRVTMNQSTQDACINFSWFNTTDVNGDKFSFTQLDIYNALFKYNVGVPNNNLYLYECFNSTDYNGGNYYFNMSVCDSFGNCNMYMSSETFELCINDYVESVQPCVNGLQLISYEDNNNCPSQLGYPSNNGTYTTCSSITEVVISESFDFIYLLLLVIALLLVLSVIIHGGFAVLGGITLAYFSFYILDRYENVFIFTVLIALSIILLLFGFVAVITNRKLGEQGI